jgi:DNA-binding FadR family transcriptional regulator
VSTPTTSEPLSPDAALTPVDVPAAYELVTERLQRAIRLGTFAPGERLPPERELARRLGVSRVTLREALRVLQGRGYIVTRRGAHGGPEVALPPDGRRAALRERLPELEELIGFRLVVEAGAAQLAATARTQADLDALAAAMDDLRAAPDVAAFRRADSRFHLSLARAARNGLLEQAIEDARERMFSATDALEFPVLVERTAAEHGAVLDAVAARRPVAASRRMAAHVRSAREQLLAVLA